MEAKVKYQCPACKQVYDTKEEAEKCFVPPVEMFKVGDLVQLTRSGLAHTLIRIVSFDRDGMGASVEKVVDDRVSNGYEKPKPDEVLQYWAPAYCWCGAKKVSLDEIEKHKNNIKRRKRQIAAAERMIALIQETHGTEPSLWVTTLAPAPKRSPQTVREDRWT